MKRIITIVCGLLCWVGEVEAQSSQSILQEMSKVLTRLKHYSVDFAMNSAEGNANGSYVVADTLFHIKTGAIELLYDGDVVYEIDNSVKEIVLDEMNDNYTIWSNPAKAFSMLDTRYQHKFEGEVKSNGKLLYRIKLTAQAKGDEDFTLFVDSATKLPYKATYGQGEHTVTIRFIRIQTDNDSNPMRFKFAKDKYAEYELIDLRTM